MAYTSDELISGLDPLAIPNGAMLLPIYDEITQHTYSVRLDLIAPAQVSQDFEYSPGTIYNEDDVVVFEDQLWISQQDNNEGVYPGTNPAYWLPGVKGSTGIPWAAGVFTQTHVTTIYKGSLYYLQSATRPYNSTNIDAEIAAGDWINLSGEDLYIFAVAGPNITLNLFNTRASMHEGAATIDGPRTWLAPTNGANSNKIKVRFVLDGAHVQTFNLGGLKLASSFNAGWDTATKQWSPVMAGEYELDATKNAAGQWRGVISGPLE